jgi:hypothetical protein
VKLLVREMHADQGVIFKALNLKTATVNKKAAKDEALSAEEGERVVGLAKLVGQLETMIAESGDPAGRCSGVAVALVARTAPCPWRQTADRSPRYDGGAVDRVECPGLRGQWSLCVSRLLWRIATDTPDYEAHDMSGEGARITGGAGTRRGSRLSMPQAADRWPVWKRSFT